MRRVSNSQGEKKFKTMNIKDIKSNKYTAPEQTFPMYPDVANMNAINMQNYFAMMNGMGVLPFGNNFAYPPFMAMQPLLPQKVASSHSSKKNYVQPMVSLPSYTEEKQIREKFECLREMNDPKFKTSTIKDADFFIIRSSNDDDLHKVVFADRRQSSTGSGRAQ